ncbi:hypothetical protein GCM10027090_11850 [Sinomonas soli]
MEEHGRAWGPTAIARLVWAAGMFRLARVRYHVRALIAAASPRSELRRYATVEAAASGQDGRGR